MPPKKNRRKGRRVLSEGDADSKNNAKGGSKTSIHAVSVTSITQNITGSNIQIGQGNVIEDRTRYGKETSETVETRGAYGCTPNPSITDKQSSQQTHVDHSKTYAEAVSGKASHNIQAVNVTININTNADTQGGQCEETSTAKLKRDQVAMFYECVGKFNRGHYILVVGKLNCLEYVDALSLVPWTAVFDFDPESRSTGLLSRIENTVNKLRSLHVGSIQDICTFSEQITNWIHLRGCSDRPDTRTANEAGDWKKEIEEDVDRKLAQLKQFGTGITHFTFVVLWSPDPSTAKCMNFVLNKVCTRMKSSVVIVDNGETKSEISNLIFTVLKEETEVTAVELGVKEMCSTISKVLKPIVVESTKYRLPTKDKTQTHDPGISEEMAQWLKEDLEILYLDNTTGIEYTAEQMEEEEDTFHKGGTLPWEWWYQVGPGHADVERDIMKTIIDYVESKYLNKSISGTIKLLHSPGSGGTTLAQQALWGLKGKTPCVQMKQNSGSPVTDLVEKITCLCDRTHKPLVLLLDGEDEHRIISLRRLADRMKICVIMLYVKRYNTDMDYYDQGNDVFMLQDKMSKREARLLKLKWNRQSEYQKRRNNVENLLTAVENDESKTIFEFGLAAHSYEYRGIESYVSGHLRLSDYEGPGLLPWHTALAYLSLAYFYGHTSLPCHFFTEMLRGEENKRILETEDFPQEMHEFIVRGVNESRLYTVRISHYYIAKEILDQVFLRSCPVERPSSPYLCNEAKKLLGMFSKGFIETAGNVNDGNSSEVISKMLINTFIKREKKDILEDETQEKRIKGPNKPQFSHILEDASSSAPYTERFDILNKLVASFPSEAQFRAHLGRLYMICRPEEEERAEENLKKAYEMSSVVLDGMQSVEEIPFTRRLDLRNICHMYGNMLSKKVFKYTGKLCTDKPVLAIDKDHFQAKAEFLLQDVQCACKLFSLNREVMYPGYEDCLGFIGEIHIRLMFCRFVKENSGTDDLQAFARNREGEVAEFVNDCYVNLDELFDEMCNVADSKSMEVGGQPLQEIYMHIMCSHPPGHIMFKSNKNTPTARRREIAQLKAQYNTKQRHGYLENLQREDEVNFIVDCYEQNFQAASSADKGLDSDYREWIRAIRHQKCSKRYTLEEVFRHVKDWFEHVSKQNNPGKKIRATFYFFVLSSLFGFGTFGQPGNVELLRKSQVLKVKLVELSKYSQNQDFQTEWLGPPVPSIDRLIQGKRYFGGPEKLSLAEKDWERLEIRTGTICPPNYKATHGLVELDLGPENRESVKIHFVPVKCQMKGKRFKGLRVQFVIGFNFFHGYEAFNVRLVGHVKCNTDNCGNNIEKRSCDNEVKCPRCLKTTAVQ